MHSCACICFLLFNYLPLVFDCYDNSECGTQAGRQAEGLVAVYKVVHFVSNISISCFLEKCIGLYIITHLHKVLYVYV